MSMHTAQGSSGAQKMIHKWYNSYFHHENSPQEKQQLLFSNSPDCSRLVYPIICQGKKVFRQVMARKGLMGPQVARSKASVESKLGYILGPPFALWVGYYLTPQYFMFLSVIIQQVALPSSLGHWRVR